MANNLLNMPRVLVLGSNTDIYACPGSGVTVAVAKKITITNIDTVSRWLTVFKYDGTNTDEIIKQISISPNNAFEITDEYLEPNDKIIAIAEGASMFKATGNIVEITP